MPNRAQRRQAEREAAKTKPAGRDAETVFVGYPADTIDFKFHRSMLHLFAFDAVTKQRIVPRGQHMQLQTTNLPHGRNQIVKQFLESDCDWLWFVDTDQVFEPDVLERMLASADPVERPILGALIFSYDNEKAARGEQPYFPTIYSVTEEGPTRAETFPPNTVMRCYATGTGCVLIHRSVLEAVGEKWGDTSFPWFRYTEYVNHEGEPDLISEDITFMARAGSCGFPVHVDTGIEVGHVKPHTAGSFQHYLYLAAMQEPPAPNYVVIPVKGKQHYTDSILEQLAEQRDTFEHCFLYDNAAGTDEALSNIGEADWLTVIPAAGKNIHEMWNLGIKEAVNRDSRCNIAILNNDLELGPNFLTELGTALRSHPSLACVGGNYDDREFPELVQQVHGICAGRYDGTGGLPGFAFMIRSDLVDALGGQVFDEQFALWYGDNDLCIRMEGIGAVYGIARDARVVHIDGGSKTSGESPTQLHPELVQITEQDRRKFEKKYAAYVKQQ